MGEDNPNYRLEKGDQLFTNDEVRTRFDKITNYSYTDYKLKSFSVLAFTYKEAADRLVESLENFTPRFNSYPTPPIVYLYRHYLELHLKYFAQELIPEFRNSPNRYNHKIGELWQKLKPILIQTSQLNTYEVSEIEAVEECIMEFADIDPDSFAFRYPIDKKGQPLLLGKPRLQDISYINLQHLAEKMAGIYRFLSELDLLMMQYSNRANTTNPTPNFE